MKEEVRDLYNSEQLHDNWITKVKSEGIEGISGTSSNLVISFIEDLSIGMNISKKSKKGGRKKNTLNRTRQKLIFVIKGLEERGIKPITKAKEEDLHKFFNDMKNGVIKTRVGTPYKSAWDYVKTLKTFWHWYQRIMKKSGVLIEDITEDLDRRGEKPKFVYFTQEDFEKLIEKASIDTKPLIALTFDSGMRLTELYNVRISDFSKDFKELQIRDETSKTFGRKIKLMICSEHIKEYVKKLELKKSDFLAQKSHSMVNKELTELGKKILTEEQTKFKNLTFYDFRHSSACFWLPRYKSESALKYRFGWKKSDMIHYYTEFLGMKDTIQEDDMYINITKTDLEKRLEKMEKSLERRKKLDKILNKLIDNPEVLKLLNR